MKVRFVADTIPTGIRGSLMLDIKDGVDNVATFLRTRIAKQKEEAKRALDEGRPENKYLLQCELGVAYRPRTMKQNNLQWELCTRIAKADHVDPETIHEAVKQIVYPKEEHYGAWIAKDGEELSTVEYASVIDWLIRECTDRADPIDIHDIWVLFTTWRYGQSFDPLEGKYATLEDYREAHPCCEACGTFLLQRDNEGVYRHTGHLSHIVSRGAGGPDASWNVFILCAQHHVSGDSAQHLHGWEGFLQIAPWLRPKYDRAQILHAQTTPVAPVDDFQDDIPWADDSNRGPAETAEVVGDQSPPAESRVESQAAIVQRVFKGEVVSAPAPKPQAPDDGMKKILAKLEAMGEKAEERQRELFPPKEPPVDYKKAAAGEKEEDIY